MAAVVSSSQPVRRWPGPVPARVLRRRRMAVAALLFTLVVGVATLVGGRGQRPPVLVAARVVVVQPGDTFWSIARRLQPTGDPRPLVDRLVAEHGGTRLVAGERIEVPPAS